MLHLVTLLGCLATLAVFVTIGLVARRGGWLRPFELITGTAFLAMLAYKYFLFWQMYHDAGLIFLPLHLCTLSEMIAGAFRQ